MPSHGTIAAKPLGLRAATRHWLPEFESVLKSVIRVRLHTRVVTDAKQAHLP
jgi:hypothetical protein